MTDADVILYKQFQKSPILFIEKMWNLVPQPIKPEYALQVESLIEQGKWKEVKPTFFYKFEKKRHITWQQWLILKAVENWAQGKGKGKISVVSGHGTGKSAALSWIIDWFLFCFKDAQVGATAPTSEQIHDVLWKELALWLGRMPQTVQESFELSGGYLRVKERAETWFARARTARKEAPEAMAGLHGEHVLIVGDEASGIPDEIYRAAEGSLTGENTLVIFISNGTRNLGYFYDTHGSDRLNWETMSFSSEDSPIVEEDYVQRMIEKYGRESDEFKIRVSGGFPNSEQMDDAGWIPLISDKDVSQVSDNLDFIGEVYMGIDPSGEGDDTTRWVVRDRFQARVVHSENTSNEKGIARKTYEIMNQYGLKPENVTCDNFGVGANVAKELLLLDHTCAINSVNWGMPAEDDSVYLNKRAECCFRGREWLIRGGAVAGDELKREVLSFPYKNNMSGKKQIMDKPNLKKRLGRSPDRGDAFFLSFFNKDATDIKQFRTASNQSFDPFEAL